MEYVHRCELYLSVDGQGSVQVNFDFQGARNETIGRMLTIDLDGVVYA